MAKLTQDGFIAELGARGHSRFLSTQLIVYLNWGLQDVYAMGRFDRTVKSVVEVLAGTDDTIAFALLNGGGDPEGVQQVSAVMVRYQGDVTQLRAAEEDEFFQIMLPNTLKTNPDKGLPSIYYIYDQIAYVYPKPANALDLYFHVLLREDTFLSGADVSNLPERFDKAILARTEVHCYRRAHNIDAMAVAANEAREFFLDELGMKAAESPAEFERVEPWRG